MKFFLSLPSNHLPYYRVLGGKERGREGQYLSITHPFFCVTTFQDFSPPSSCKKGQEEIRDGGDSIAARGEITLLLPVGRREGGVERREMVLLH